MFYLDYSSDRKISVLVYLTVQNEYTLPNGSHVGYYIVRVFLRDVINKIVS
jgi:hypothetical protein